MKRLAIQLLAVNLLLAAAACERAEVVDRDVVVNEDSPGFNEADECPRADGQPCK